MEVMTVVGGMVAAWLIMANKTPARRASATMRSPRECHTLGPEDGHRRSVAVAIRVMIPRAVVRPRGMGHVRDRKDRAPRAQPALRNCAGSVGASGAGAGALGSGAERARNGRGGNRDVGRILDQHGDERRPGTGLYRAG